jgi:hypothetical protein
VPDSKVVQILMPCGRGIEGEGEAFDDAILKIAIN